MKWPIFLLALLLAAQQSAAQTAYPPETRNAALRYWMAFADMQDPPADKATQELVDKVASGESPWDEEKLGSLLDKNQAAILAMHRATRLPDCDWGLEYREGVRTSIAYAPRARVLARMNTLYGLRMAARGDTQQAIEAWLAGIRFSTDLSKGGSLIFALIAKSSVLPDLRALTRASRSGALSAEQRKQVEGVVGSLPEAAFDWAEAMRLEEAGVYSFLDQLARAPNPAEYYASVMGTGAEKDFSVPSAADRTAYHKVMLAAEAELKRPPLAAAERLKALEDQVGHMPGFFRHASPSLTRTNQARGEIASARAGLLEALGPR
jgi:hypothetical protein